MVIYLVRHPETMRNLENRFTGWEDTEYSKKGYIQFKKVCNYFVENEIRLPIFSSDLPRALKLGKAISKKMGSSLTISPSLREQNFRKTKPNESYEEKIDVIQRVHDFFNKNFGNNRIIVSHAGTTEILISLLLNKDKGDTIKDFPRDVIFKIETVKNKNKLSVIRI